MTDAKTGGCLCGAVRYEITGTPLFAGNCYCSDCQKFTGGGHLTFIGMPESAVKVTGEQATYTMTGDSGGPITRYFCPACGTHLGAVVAGGIRTILPGTLDDPRAFTPSVNIYTASAQHWDTPSPDIPGFEAGPPQG